MVAIKSFALEYPRIDPALLPANAATRAVNCHVKNGKLKAYMAPKRRAFSSQAAPISIYRQREDDSWLDWATDVDVIRSPLDTTPDTLIYTGDGRPQIRAVGASAHYDLGLPAPVTAPTVTAGTGGVTGTVANIARIVRDSYVSSGPEDGRISVGTNNTKDLSVTVNGEETISIRVSVKYSLSVTGTAEPVLINRNLYRDGTDASDIITAEQFQHEGGTGGATKEYVREYIEIPSAGTHTYRTEFYRASFSGGESISSETVEWNVEIRVNNRMRISTGAAHGLAVDARVQFADIVGTGSLPSDMNLKTFTVAEIVDPTTFDIAAMIEGQYTSGGTWSQYWSPGDVESRAYRYTYVATINGVDYEGPASDASAIVDAGQGQPVVVDGFAGFPGDWNSPANKIRIYRFAATSSTTGQYQFVAEIDISDAEYVDQVLGENLGESLPDPDREPPPEDLQGLIELASGSAAGFVGKTIYLAKPNEMHAWPLDYARSAHEEIVAIGAFGASIAVATKGQPYILTGADPADMTMDRLEIAQPCMSKDGCVDFGYAWTYPSDEGLVLVATGRCEVITLELFTKEEWSALNPSSFMAARYDSYYVCFFEKADGEKGGFIFDLLNPRGGVAFLDFWANAVWTDPSTGNLFIAQDNKIKEFNADTLELVLTWRSREFGTSETTMTAMVVEAKKYPVSVSVFADGVEQVSVQVSSRTGFRINATGSRWLIEVRGQHQIDNVYMAENMASLARQMAA